ncbi:MAG: hypothetical protein BGO43_01195 [Gammaproteobacteria bacterium 39-13]|nr:MAG: hypothetical protein BGO43_01195 [Gammaproteobacteria bacterium 39-13]
MVQLLSIPVNFKHSAFSNIHGFERGRTFFDYLKAIHLKHYGHVDPNFVHKLMTDTKHFSALLERGFQNFIKNLKLLFLIRRF